jgi:D-alanine-D-alanine ligase
MTTDKVRVAILFGGRSGEHEVSLASARSVMAALNKDKYEISAVGITKTGRWLTTGDPMAALASGEPEAYLASGEHTAHGAAQGAAHEAACDAVVPLGGRDLVPGTSRAGFPDADVVFPVLHGPYGEDGTVQGLLELADLPYVGSGVLGSVVGMDKAAMKSVLIAQGLPVVDYELVLRKAWQSRPDEIIARVEGRFEYPMFVKPANLGSSVGVSKAHDRDELRYGLDLAARYDRKILVETAVNAREIECSVLGNDEPIASVPGEVVPCNEFYDYKAKYIEVDSELHIPADLSAEMTRQVQDLAVRAFQAIDAAGMARVDFFVCRDTGRIYINELNTIPGFTQISMYPKLWEASGIPYPELLDRLIELAMERARDKRASDTAYHFDH